MTTDHFEFKTDKTGTAYELNHPLVSSYQTGGTTDGKHKGWVDLVSVSQPVIRDGDDKHGSVTDWCPILDV
jgi:hypothetical protein